MTLHSLFTRAALLSLVFISVANSSIAQDNLSLDKAIQTALANNHQIRIRQFDVDRTKLQVNPAMVGRKPTVNFNASYELGWSDTDTETLALGPGQEGNTEIKLDGFSNDIIIGPEVNLLLLDGKASKYRLDQLATSSELAKLQLQQTMEQTVADVSAAYLQMGEIQSQLSIIRQSIQLTQDRLARTKQNAKYGTSNSLEALQVEVDLKTDSTTLRNLLLNYETANRNLNRLMGIDSEIPFVVDSQLVINTTIDVKELETALKNQNTLLQLGQRNIQLADLDLELSRAAFKPTLSAYANASFAYLQDDANFLQSTRSFGPNVGVRFSYPIADGGARKIKEQSALISQEQRRLERESNEEDLIKNLRNTFASYQNILQQWRIEKSNLPTFERNLENLQNQYKLGLVTNTDVRSAQLNLNAALSRINDYQYTIKQAEVQLYLLSGKLLK